MPEPVPISEPLDELLFGLLAYAGPIQRRLINQTYAGRCEICKKQVVNVAAISWAIEHTEATGHPVDVDYHSRHRVTKPRQAS